MLVELGAGGTALSGGARGLERRGDGDRCGPPLWGGRQTVHEWLRTYATGGLGGLADRSSRPWSCPHQMAPVVEARIVEMRRAHPGWGPRTIVYWLEREGVVPVPGRTSMERCLVRHGLVTPQARKRKRSDYRRWERSRAMELWQMDIVGGVRLVDGTRGEDRVGHRRPLPVRDLGAGGGPGHRPAGVRRAGAGDGTPWGARGDPDRQRQGVHRPVRARPRAGAVRSDLPGERDQAPPHRAPVADHDRQDRALAQDAARRVPDRQGVRLDRRRPGPARWLGPGLQPRTAAPVAREGATVRTVPARRRLDLARSNASRPSHRPPPSR